MTRQKEIYLAIIGDLVASREMPPPQRNAVQKRFEETLDGINADFGEHIRARFLITAGDETQGLLHRVEKAYEITRRIQIELKPTRIVFGLGVGELDTEIEEYAVGADGPAFHRARRALTEAKSERKAYGNAIKREVKMHSPFDDKDRIVNALWLAASVIRARWTEKQSKILSLVEAGESATEVETKLKIPLSNISRTVDAGHYREYQEITDLLQGLLKDYSRVE